VVSWLTEALVEQERDVTLFASGDSVTAVKLEPMWPREQGFFMAKGLASPRD
jgi:hypothetical protein